jgi:protein TonB
LSGRTEKANAALAADQLFEPAGRSVLDHYLAALDATREQATDEDDKRARRLSDAMASNDRQVQIKMAIADIFPAGLTWIELALADDQREAADRVLRLLERAQPDSMALQRLRLRLEQPPEVASTSPAADAVRAVSVGQQVSPTEQADPISGSPFPPVANSIGAPPTLDPPDATPSQTTLAPSTATAAEAVIAKSTTPELPAAGSTPATSPADAPSARAQNFQPVVVSQVAPRYPPRAVRQRLEGWVKVGFTIEPDGSVGAVKILDSEPSGVFDFEAVRSIKRWRFKPTGQQVMAQRQIEFKLGQL